MNKKIIFILFVIAAAALFWIFNPAQHKNIETVTPVRMQAVQAVYATGTVEASRMIPVSPRVAARLMELKADEGVRVEAGDILAQLEDADLRENLKELEAQLELAQSEFMRAERLWKSRAISKTGFEQAQTQLTAAQANVERTKAEMGYLQLIAPEAGTIIRRDGEIGEMIPVGTNVFWINGGDKIRIETEVDEEDIGLVETGQKVVIRADAFPDEIFEGSVQSVTPKGDPVARSYRVRVGLENTTPMMIGMTAETNIITQVKDDALMVPSSALGNGHIVKIENGAAIIAPVRTGIKTPKKVEILEGAGEGDIIAKKFDSTLADKGRIKAKTKEWKPDAE